MALVHLVYSVYFRSIFRSCQQLDPLIVAVNPELGLVFGTHKQRNRASICNRAINNFINKFITSTTKFKHSSLELCSFYSRLGLPLRSFSISFLMPFHLYFSFYFILLISSLCRRGHLLLLFLFFSCFFLLVSCDFLFTLHQRPTIHHRLPPITTIIEEYTILVFTAVTVQASAEAFFLYCNHWRREQQGSECHTYEYVPL